MTDESIKIEGYKERPEKDYTHGMQWLKNVQMYQKCGKILYPSTRHIYTFIKNYCIDFVRNHPQYPDFVWKPKIIDIGCGGGFGSNVLSQEADFVYGIDKSIPNINWAKEVFTREKSGVYYSSQMSFDVVDPITDSREFMAFDIVACVEVIEHVDEYQKLLDFIVRICKKDKSGKYMEPPDATKVFISTPNRNHYKISDESPKNKAHVREWTPSELYDILTKRFKYVTIMNEFGELRELDMQEAVMLFKCETPI